MPESESVDANDEKDTDLPIPHIKKSRRKKKTALKENPPPDDERDKYQKKILKQKRYMPVIDHIEELRWAIIRSIIWIVVLSGVSMLFYDEIFKVIIDPVGHLVDSGKKQNVIVKVIVTQLTDYFVIQFKLTLLMGFLLAIPAIIFELLKFIMPALDKKYRKWSFVFLFCSVSLFWGGIYIAWRYFWDMVIEFLVLNWIPPGILTNTGLQLPEVHLTMAEYLSFFMGFHLTFGVSFQMPIICVLLTLAGIINSRYYFKYWRYIIFIIAIVSAVVSPPDVMSMLFMMIPLMVLYIISGIFVFIFERRS
ncbi:MAG: twin-arginine translocase subunit TatC [Spirochaetia bacterium]|nr:twin-arginine translocase subunit TatC [Spirochaetia bacterium]